MLRKSSGFDSHHRLHRYRWEMLVGDEYAVVGYDVAETDEEGKVRRVLSFFEPLPPMAD
jgi:hypothetical protein